MTVRVGSSYRYNPETFPSTGELQSLINGDALEIVLGAGTYNLTLPLSIPAGVTLRGDGSGSTIIQWNTTSTASAILTLVAGARLKGLTVKKAVGSGAVTSAVVTGGDNCVLDDVETVNMPITIDHDRARVTRCLSSGLSGGVQLNGDGGLVSECYLSTCAKAISVTGDSNQVLNNRVEGDSGSTHGIHVSGTANFNLISQNLISDIQGSPGHGVLLDSGTGASNQVGFNIFFGTFGGKTITVDASVDNTTQIIGNQTIEASPGGARLVTADLGGATGFMNT